MVEKDIRHLVDQVDGYPIVFAGVFACFAFVCYAVGVRISRGSHADCISFITLEARKLFE